MNLSIECDKKIDSKEEIENLTHKAYELNRVFFEKDLGELNIKLFYSRSDFDVRFEEVYNQKSLPWTVSWIPENYLIYIFSPAVFQKETSHSEGNFIKVLTHEIAHIFIREIYKIKKPRWLIEGLADYISGKNFSNVKLKEIIDFGDLHNFNDFHKYNAYNQSGLFVKYLLDEFGKDKLFSLLSVPMHSNDDFGTFCKIFEEVYGFDFRDIVKNWSVCL